MVGTSFGRLEKAYENDELACTATVASGDLPKDKRTEAGRLCNDIAGYFSLIDEAADAGKKHETVAIHQQLAGTISKLEALSAK